MTTKSCITRQAQQAIYPASMLHPDSCIKHPAYPNSQVSSTKKSYSRQGPWLRCLGCRCISCSSRSRSSGDKRADAFVCCCCCSVSCTCVMNWAGKAPLLLAPCSTTCHYTSLSARMTWVVKLDRMLKHIVDDTRQETCSKSSAGQQQHGSA